MPAFGSTKTLTILGGTKIKAEFEHGMPRANESHGVKTEVTGFAIDHKKVVPAMGFSYSGTSKLLYVAVDEVSGPSPVRMVEDLTPKLERNFWKGSGAPRALNKEESRWVFERGDTLVVYRFTIRLEGSNDDVVIYQPAVFAEGTKKMLRQLADGNKG